MNESLSALPVGIRISPQVLEQTCKTMIKVVLYALPHAVRGTIYTVGPVPDLRVVRVASGHRNGELEDIRWDVAIRSEYDFPGKVWEQYRDRPGGVLEAMAWCVERQKSWTADDPDHDVRSVRKRRGGRAGEDYHHMEPVLVQRTDLWDQTPPLSSYPKDSSGNPIWQQSQYASVAVVKIHFLPGSIKGGDRSTQIIKEMSRSLGTQMLSLHAREIAFAKEKQLTQERLETSNVLAHEFRNLVSRIGFACRAVNNEIAYLRESWEDLVHHHFPEQPNKRKLLQRLDEILAAIRAEPASGEIADQFSRLAEFQRQMMESCLLPHQNETWLREKIQPAWSSIMTTIGLPPHKRSHIEELLEALRTSFHVGKDETFMKGITGIPDGTKRKWVDLAYRAWNASNDGVLAQYIELIESLDLKIPRKRYSLNNLVCLKPLVELMPEIEKKVNSSLAQLGNKG
jgi:hypothetical protein